MRSSLNAKLVRSAARIGYASRRVRAMVPLNAFEFETMKGERKKIIDNGVIISKANSL